MDIQQQSSEEYQNSRKDMSTKTVWRSFFKCAVAPFFLWLCAGAWSIENLFEFLLITTGAFFPLLVALYAFFDLRAQKMQWYMILFLPLLIGSLLTVGLTFLTFYLSEKNCTYCLLPFLSMIFAGVYFVSVASIIMLKDSSQKDA